MEDNKQTKSIIQPAEYPVKGKYHTGCILFENGELIYDYQRDGVSTVFTLDMLKNVRTELNEIIAFMEQPNVVDRRNHVFITDEQWRNMYHAPFENMTDRREYVAWRTSATNFIRQVLPKWTEEALNSISGASLRDIEKQAYEAVNNSAKSQESREG